jgi:hypothetical protein
MTNYEWSFENIKKVINHPIRALDEVALDYAYRLPVAIFNGFYTIGTNVFNKDWDILILLDTCRVDALREVKDEYEFLNDIGSIWSVGGSSAEWIARTFDKNHIDTIGETAYLSANAHVKQVLDSKRQYDSNKHLTYKSLRSIPSVDVTDLGKVEYLFTYESWGEEGPRGHTEGMTPPRYVTDRAIQVCREDDYEQVVLHYFQPHSPYVANALEDGRELKEYEDDWWGYITETGDVATVWESYLDDLRYVLDDVELLLKNVEAESIVISADHGEAFGEYGILGHKIGSLHPKIRKVPWAITSARDTNSYTPTVKEPETPEMSRKDLDRQLEALGYKV